MSPSATNASDPTWAFHDRVRGVHALTTALFLTQLLPSSTYPIRPQLQQLQQLQQLVDQALVD